MVMSPFEREKLYWKRHYQDKKKDPAWLAEKRRKAREYNSKKRAEAKRKREAAELVKKQFT